MKGVWFLSELTWVRQIFPESGKEKHFSGEHTILNKIRTVKIYKGTFIKIDQPGPQVEWDGLGFATILQN